MQIERLRTFLDAPDEADAWFAPLGVADTRTAHANMLRLASAGLPLDLLGVIWEQFAATGDIDIALPVVEPKTRR